jgi:cell division protein FtsZ
VDTLIVVPNDRLLGIFDYRVSVDDAFTIADEILQNGVLAISGLITMPGLINLDFADVKTVMSNAGQAWMAIGEGNGPNRAIDAAWAAITSPLLDVTITGATGVLLNFTGDSSLTISEVHEAAEIIKDAVDPNANIIFGVAHDSSMNDDIRITLIATGFPGGKQVGIQNVEEMRRKLAALKGVKEGGKLDTPTFLRHRLLPRRGQAVALPSKVIPARPERVVKLR